MTLETNFLFHSHEQTLHIGLLTNMHTVGRNLKPKEEEVFFQRSVFFLRCNILNRHYGKFALEIFPINLKLTGLFAVNVPVKLLFPVKLNWFISVLAVSGVEVKN